MKHSNFIDVVSYNTILKAHLALGHFQEARSLLQEMTACGLPAYKVTYNELLNALVIAKDRPEPGLCPMIWKPQGLHQILPHVPCS